MSWKNNYATFDLETGGLITKNKPLPPITEIAICVMDPELNDTEEYTSMIIPYVEEKFYEQPALNASHITLEMCREQGKPSDVVAKEVEAFFKKHFYKDGKTSRKPILGGHNIDAFDIPILDNFLSLHEVDLEKITNLDFTIDTMKWARQTFSNLSGYTLGDCLTEVGIDLTNAHRALFDTRANHKLVRYFLENLRGKGGIGQKEEKQRFRTGFSYGF